ncbi:AMP-binding protein [Haloplanus halophilus]|uniref:AMP-binding protein n=1 Tax=Haloplanus halophilus TaxID=2949993 RepID=UPI0020412AB0|nr:AMP-binding protein [Haloplanus sp. GDY1]
MRVLGDLVGRDRRSERVALDVTTRGREVSYRDFCTTSWKAGHALAHLGVHEGSRVALAPDPEPEIVETLFGASLLGARVTFDVDADARVVMGAVDSEAALTDGERKVLVYGGAPSAATATHWEGVVWSENPSLPPGERSPDDPVVVDGASTLTHRDLCARAAGVVDGAGLGEGTAVALRASLADPRAVIAGVIAPLLAGGTVVLPGDEAAAEVAVGEGTVPEPERIDLDAV